MTLMDAPVSASGVGTPVAVTTICCATTEGESVRSISTGCAPPMNLSSLTAGWNEAAWARTRKRPCLAMVKE